ncbi:hypothetical protein IVB15_01715 [Bradyrhizobium sp. 182]|uniref:hypothetical protein n=1 Tax=unclassified Bradyrhizobium TaxID=2631580 RepID=UPI001FF854B0|nr:MULTISPECIES: hypothetical protein [unclassified Bradyrhizobium]MCK1526492.1 hypothetical protein [Bradyrhizobium sp. 182]MCK1618879.1 hypothetical protein [Bradyrhizobium sp. 159]
MNEPNPETRCVAFMERQLKAAVDGEQVRIAKSIPMSANPPRCSCEASNYLSVRFSFFGMLPMMTANSLQA